MAEAAGPVMTGGFEDFVINDPTGDYRILYLPDLHNDDLQREGKPPVFYWVPGTVRMARGPGGDYMFHQIHFVGVMDKDTTVGEDEHSEVVGGVLSFTTTSEYPPTVLQKSQEQLLTKWQGKDTPYWGIRSNIKPQFRIVPITNNLTSLTNLSPGLDGSLPVAEGAPSNGGANPSSGGTNPSNGGANPSDRRNKSQVIKSVRVRHGRTFKAPSNLNRWSWQLQGQGPGSITGGQNAYSGLIGSIPSEIIWAGFHGAYSPIVVQQTLQIPMWSQGLHLRMTGNWHRAFEHFSAALKASGGLFWSSSVDLKTEFNNLRANGGIQVEIEIDGTRPDAADMEKEVNKRVEVIFSQWMEEAKKIIFEPMPSVEAAKAESGGGWFGGGGFAMKWKSDQADVAVTYEETKHFLYNHSTTISSSLEGFFNEIKRDPANEKKYFTRLVLGELNRKVTRIVKPVANYTSDPIEFMSVQVGYPNSDGSINWYPHVFQRSDTSEMSNFQPVFVKRGLDEITNPPSSWMPDMTFVKRTIHLSEPPDESESPYVRIFVEKNTISLDPEPNGSLINDNTVEVRADRTGVMILDPISLNVELDDKTIIEVSFQSKQKTEDGQDRPITRFSWKKEDVDQKRLWKIFTGDPNFKPAFRYQVHVIVKGSIFSHGVEWTGPWVESSGNGGFVVSVPTMDDPGVVVNHRKPPRFGQLSAPSDLSNSRRNTVDGWNITPTMEKDIKDNLRLGPPEAKYNLSNPSTRSSSSRVMSIKTNRSIGAPEGEPSSNPKKEQEEVLGWFPTEWKSEECSPDV